MTRAAFDLSANQGAAVLSLMERALIPPVPAFYRLFFDYVAGANTATTEPTYVERQLSRSVQATP